MTYKSKYDGWPLRDADLPDDGTDWSETQIEVAAEAIMLARTQWGWTFHRAPKVMAIDLIMAKAALQAVQAIKARRATTGTGVVHESAVAESDAPNKPEDRP